MDTNAKEREQEEEKKLGEYKRLGIAPSYRAVIEFDHGGSVCTLPWHSKRMAKAEAKRLCRDYDRTAAVGYGKVVWHGAELERALTARERNKQ